MNEAEVSSVLHNSCANAETFLREPPVGSNNVFMRQGTASGDVHHVVVVVAELFFCAEAALVARRARTRH